MNSPQKHDTFTRANTKIKQEETLLFDVRFSQKIKNLSNKQDMTIKKSLDTDLMKYFGFGKRQFKNIVKKPGNKFGFKLSNYIHAGDSVSTVNHILEEIAAHIEFTKSSPVKAIFHKNFKDELRVKFFARNPRKYLLKLHIGATFMYKRNDGEVTINSNRNINRNIIRLRSPKEISSLVNTSPREVSINDDVFMVFTIDAALQEEIEHSINISGSASEIVDIWFETKPVVIEQSHLTKDQFLEDELMERASVLSDNFLKHAGGIHQKAKEDTDGKCVEHQLLEFFLNPGYTDPITKIPECYQAEVMTELNANTLNSYLESLPKPKTGNGFSARQLAMMCVDLRLNMYALDHSSKTFVRINQFSLTRPKGQSGDVHHHPLAFYCANKHFYLITHPESIKSIVESCKDTVDTRDFQETDEVITEAMVVRSSAGKKVAELLLDEEGHYIMEQDSLEEEVFDYMERSGCAPTIQLKNNRIVGFTVSEVTSPKPIPSAPVKPKRSEFTKGKKGQPDYEKAVAAHNLATIEHKKACVALKNAPVSKSHKTHKFSCNPNFLEGFPHEAVKLVCENSGIPFHNQGLGSLGLEMAHIDKTLKRINITKETKQMLLEEQESKCANEDCATAISLCNSHCDHMKPHSNGGKNDPENLQMLCIPCHKAKSAAEREEGYGCDFPDYHSQFSPSVFEHVVKHIHPLAFVELTDAAIEPMKEKKTTSHNEQPEKLGTNFTIQKDTSGQEIIDNITKGSITYERAIKSLKMLDEIYQSRESKNRLQFVKNRSHTLKNSTLDGSITHQIQPQVRKQGAAIGAPLVEMKQTRLKETYYTDETLKKMAKWQIDFKGQYPNLMKYRKNNWPKYSVMDAPRPFSGTITEHNAGWYYVVTNQTFPFRGSSWYPVQTVCLGLHHQLISLQDIKTEWLPSATLEKDHFVSYLDRIDQAFEGLDSQFTTTTMTTTGTTKEWTLKSLQKAVKCSLVGAFAQKERHSEWAKVTQSPALATNWVINDGNDQDSFVSQPFACTSNKYKDIYVGQFSKTLAIESSACMIRAEILEASSRAMFLLEYATKQIGGTPLWRKTDAVGGMGPCIDISTYYWDEEKTTPMLQFETPAAPKDERKPREIRAPLPDCIFHHYLGYKWHVDSSYDGTDSQEFASKLVNYKRGFFLNGRAGTGKTTLANLTIDVLEEKQVKYWAFSTTHVSKKKMGSTKSQLRVGKQANTIDSLYRRWRHKQEFVITALKSVEYILVDEISMMREKFYAMLCHIKRAIPGMKFILIGDYYQFRAVKDSWKGAAEAVEDSAALYDLCDGFKVHLTKCLREDGEGQELFNVCTNVIDGEDINTEEFAVTEETDENVAFYHRTRIPINANWMKKVTANLPESKLIKLDKISEDVHSQDVTLCENMPVICIRKSKALGVDNGERFTVQSFSDVPDYAAMKKPELKQHCKEKGLKRSGTKTTLVERLLAASSDIVLHLTDGSTDDVPIRVPRHLFQKHFYVAYCITFYQSQGCTLTKKYTIHDWYGYHVDWRAKYVALSRATSKTNVQIVQQT